MGDFEVEDHWLDSFTQTTLIGVVELTGNSSWCDYWIALPPYYEASPNPSFGITVSNSRNSYNGKDQVLRDVLCWSI